jgi:hypothetical protein
MPLTDFRKIHLLKVAERVPPSDNQMIRDPIEQRLGQRFV